MQSFKTGGEVAESLEYPFAPWQLTGEAFMFMYRLPRNNATAVSHWPLEFQKSFKGGWAFLMLVNYKDSPVGPYKELLFIPGKAETPVGVCQSISRIFVDSAASVAGGRGNWGIPKYLADFDWVKEGRESQIKVSWQGKEVFQARIRKSKLPFPVSTTFFPLHLYQEWEGDSFETKPFGSGRGHWARVKSMQCDPKGVPNWCGFNPWVGMYIDPFKLTFPRPI